jgi:4-amino-4-deoxy-L-arabinose transferase-like glycosyltransferase
VNALASPTTAPLASAPHADRRPLIWLALALVTALAAALRLVDLGSVRLDPFYDAAVRSMGVSWHNFFFGAYEPGGSVSIDKPPVDLWLAVASVKLFGWSSFTLKLPQALAGTAAVPLLYGAIRRPFGPLAGLAAALVLAVMPIDVVTARSDTMDAVMMLALVAALYALVRACQSSSVAWLLGAAALLGLAFEVKLLESLVALPGLLAIAWLGLPAGATRRQHPTSRRLARLGAAAAVYLVVSLSWLTATLAVPAAQRPWAIGSTNGSAWNAAFVFNGSERITGKTMEPGQGATGSASTIAPPSPTRLLARHGELPGTWLGWEALAALLLGGAATVALWRARARDKRETGPPGQAEHARRAIATGLLLWLLTGLVLFSAMARLHPRYVEGFTPAVAGMLGIGLAWLACAKSRVRLLAAPLAALLVIPLATSVQAIEGHSSDAGNVGAMRPAEQRALSTYLRANTRGARYELAAGSATSVASLIVSDARPVLMLTTYSGRPLTSLARLKALIGARQVRYAFLDSPCDSRAGTASAGCAPAARWIRAHATDVSATAGLRRPGVLWRL